ncbi:MAG: ParM/StbA family protein [Desulfurella sp.]
MRRLVIDIGYGDVKFKIDDEYQAKFPSTFSQQTVYKDFKGETRDRGYYQTGNRLLQYAIGLQSELYKGGIVYIENYDDLVKFAPYFVFHAIQLAKQKGIDGTFNKLITGLTIREWHERQRFFNAIKEININDETITFDKRVAYVQGQGIYFNNTTEEERKKYISVLDIGYNTVDILLFKDNTIIEECSTVRTYGVEIMVNELQNFINQQYKANISEQQAKLALENKSIDIDGKTINLEEIIYYIVSKYATDTLITTKKHLKGYMISKIIVSGGGAYLLENVPLNDPFVLSKKPYEFQNVEGYYNYDKEIEGD